MRGSNSIRIACSRAAGDIRYRTTAEESVIAPPKPSIVWKLRVGSTTIVGALGCALVNGTVPASVSLSVPSAVVIQTWALVDRPAAREFSTADEDAIAVVKTSVEA